MMKVKEFLEKFDNIEPDAEIFVSSDEEWNCLFKGIEIEQVEGQCKYVIFGLSGTEEELL